MTATFIEKAKAIHGDKFDYSKANYVNMSSKTTITCPKHGDFEQSPYNHFKSRRGGCPKCSEKYSYTTEEFIQKAQQVHGNKFDYSKSVYTNAFSKVIITCPEHGDFEQVARKHHSGGGCQKCCGRNRTNEEFVKKAKDIHGDKFDYSKTVYTKSVGKVIITCPEHGDFEQVAISHLKGFIGCPKCSGKYSFTTEEFIQKAKDVYGDKFGYSKSVCLRNKSKVIITCPEHGDFKQAIISHLKGFIGCPKCSGTHPITTQEFIQKAKDAHGDKYGYSNVVCKNASQRVIITCPKHGDFEQVARAHYLGSGCSRCSKKYSCTTEEFIQKARQVHGDKFDYSKSVYLRNKSKIIITCPEHGDFEQSPKAHLRLKQGCPQCAGRWDKNSTLAFLVSLRPCITMDAGDLMAVARQGNIPKILIKLNGKKDSLVSILQDICDSQNSPQEKQSKFDNLVNSISDGDDENYEDSELSDSFDTPDENQTAPDKISTLDEQEEFLPSYISVDDLRMLKGLIERYCDDEQIIKYLISKRVNRLWYELFQTDNITRINEVLKDGQCQLVTDEFLREYNGAKAVDIPDGFSYTNGREHISPNWMQRLTAWKLQEYKRIGNWSGVGAGKTLSAIFAGRHIGCKNTVVIANNNTIDGWIKSIQTFFPNSSVAEIHDIHTLSVDGFRYVVVNYDKFSLAKSKTLVNKLLSINPDFIVVDELQSVKQREGAHNSRRRKAVNYFVSESSNQNSDLYVLGMSATPCVNNLLEIRSLLELILGVNLEHMSTRPTWANASAFHELLVCHGLRYKPEYARGVEPVKVPIDGTAWHQDIYKTAKAANGSNLPIEQLLCRIKVDEIMSHVVPGTIIYTHYVDDIVSMLLKSCEDAGFKAASFIGDNSSLEKNQNKQRFLDGRIDVLIGSSAIGTGVDELQTVCAKLIFASLPWTYAEYEQIVGRVYRQGRVIDKVDIVLPQVEIKWSDTDGKLLKWSRDVERFNILSRKRTLMDCAIDGDRPDIDLAKEHKMALDGLEAMIERLKAGNESTEMGNVPKTALQIDDKEVAERRSSELTVLNRTWSTMKSETLHNLLVKEPKRWRRYHVLLRESRKTWSEVPFEVIAKQINRDDWLIADLGCGEALFADLLPNTVHSYDHVAVNDNVTACDIAHMPCDSEVYDAVVMSLVCMGANWRDYFGEANRILKSHGMLFVAEPLKNVFNEEERIQEIRSAIEEHGFDIVSQDLSGGFLYLRAIKQI